MVDTEKTAEIPSYDNMKELSRLAREASKETGCHISVMWFDGKPFVTADYTDTIPGVTRNPTSQRDAEEYHAMIKRVVAKFKDSPIPVIIAKAPLRGERLAIT